MCCCHLINSDPKAYIIHSKKTAFLLEIAATRLGLKDGRSIHQYEGGENEPTLSRLVLIAKLFHVSLDSLAGTTDEVISKDQTTLLNAFDSLPKEKQQDAIKLLTALQ